MCPSAHSRLSSDSIMTALKFDYLIYSIVVVVYSIILFSIAAAQEFTPPAATVLALSPKGIRMSIPHEDGIQYVSFHIKFNEEDEYGPRLIARFQDDGKWTYEDRSLRLIPGDIVYYWIHFRYNGLKYHLHDQRYLVTKLHSRGNTSPVVVQCTTKSVTKIIDKDGGVASEPCPSQIIFEDHFDTFNKTKWLVNEHFAIAPDYEFVVYKNHRDNLKIQDGNLRIVPDALSRKYGTDYVRHGNLTLPSCTRESGSTDCHKEAFGSYIIPPISSGKLTTEKFFRFMYGRVEIRAKLPRGDWIYPILSLESFKSNVSEESRVPLRVACSVGNPSLITTEELEIDGRLLRGGAIIHSPDKPDIRYRPETGSTMNRLWSSDFHVYELVWKPDNLVLKVDGKTYASSDSKRLKRHLQNPMFLHLAVAVGGRREFPDNCISGKYKKPWRNQGSKAMFDFHNAMDNWLSTWEDGRKDLIVDYVKVHAL